MFILGLVFPFTSKEHDKTRTLPSLENARERAREREREMKKYASHVSISFFFALHITLFSFSSFAVYLTRTLFRGFVYRLGRRRLRRCSNTSVNRHWYSPSPSSLPVVFLSLSSFSFSPSHCLLPLLTRIFLPPLLLLSFFFSRSTLAWSMCARARSSFLFSSPSFTMPTS